MKLITFEDIFSCQVDPPSVILVEGEAGTLKSALCFSLMLDILKDPKASGLYITLEQTWESHLINMKSLGFKPPENLLSLDFNIMRKDIRGNETNVRFFDSVLEVISSLKREKGDDFKVFALDSLNAIYSIMDRKFIEYSLTPFFRKLKDLNIISLIIYENMSPTSKSRLRERFLADGIISLGVQRQRGDVMRYLQLLKFNMADHNLRRRHLEAGKEGISLLGEVYR